MDRHEHGAPPSKSHCALFMFELLRGACGNLSATPSALEVCRTTYRLAGLGLGRQDLVIWPTQIVSRTWGSVARAAQGRLRAL